MSRFELNRFLFDLKMSTATLQRARADLQDAMSAYDLNNEEKNALATLDPRGLSRLGAHGMLALWIMQLHPEFKANTYWEQK